MATVIIIKLAVYLVEDVHELASKAFIGIQKWSTHTLWAGIGASPHPSDNSSFTFYYLQHSQFAKACGQSEIRLCLQAKFVMIVTKQLLMIPWKHKHLIFSNTKFSLTIIRHAFFILNLLTLLANLVPRVLYYPPYGGRVGENPGNEVASWPSSSKDG